MFEESFDCEVHRMALVEESDLMVMDRFSSNKAKDIAWRISQMHANNAIEGVKKDEALAAMVEDWNEAGVSDEAQISRLVQMAKHQ
ncbi:hypothetical protein G6L28_14830 [Agrobacterium larrymoorei]|uniref:hypothetical protein n=1 Tax=Agrobacterium larrymoorei TaxID=160699 RepID=UPI001573EC8A|nr:hypothetical protein [Agrobacterium larrymoorei]NTJ43875.1 hypothetical protein [Agrobacterium larrymoorei]